MKSIVDILKGRGEKPVESKTEEKRMRRISRLNRVSLLLHMIFSVAGYFVIEAMSRHSIRAAAAFLADKPVVFFYNAFIIFLTSLPAFLMRKRAFWRVFISIFWLVLGAVNGLILARRVTPLTGPDLKMIRDGFRVIGKYFAVWQIIVAIAVLAVLVLALIWFFFRSPSYKGRMRRRIYLPVIALLCVGFYFLTVALIRARVLSSYFGNIAFAYTDYGFPYSLGVTVFDTGINEPNGYSEELVMQVKGREGDPVEESVDRDFPNIVVVQLESFFDPTRVRGIRFSEDPIPNWHALSDECVSGFFRVPTVGAGTVNTEFEVLTGMTLRYFGAGEYPYKGILLKNTCESAPYDLAPLGYTSHAIHNNEANFYGRPDVYAHLGFNSFTSSEFMNNQRDVNESGWMRDRNLIDCVTDALDSTEGQDFVFTVSVQPHGAYPTEQVLTDPEIKVSGAMTNEERWAWEYYINQIHEVDRFAADLISVLEARDEETIVLFYGDHLPTMGLDNRDLPSSSTIYDTDYLIWSNFELAGRDMRLASYQAVAEVMNLAGIHTGTMFRYHQTMRLARNYLPYMQILQYDMLYGERYVYGKTNPYPATILALGVKPIRVSEIRELGPEGMYAVRGENFTESCVFMKNGEAVDTTYVDPTYLIIRNMELSRGDWVGVGVKSNTEGSSEILSTSNTLVYGSGKLRSPS